MIALAEKSRRKKQSKPPAPTFEELLPSITKQASVAFRDSPPCEREEQVAETIANCFVAYVRLLERGLGNVIFASPLRASVRYASASPGSDTRLACGTLMATRRSSCSS